MKLPHTIKIISVALAGGLFALSALAQWQYIDKDGRKVFSDRAPPADIQEKNILKRPAGSVKAPSAAGTEAAASIASSKPKTAASAPAVKASAPKLSGKDTELEAKKKKAEEEEAARKKVEDEKVAKAKAETCDRAKNGLAALQSGVRMAGVNAKGEREVYDDAKRVAETKRIQEVADASCN
jgi:hypothetical protein